MDELLEPAGPMLRVGGSAAGAVVRSLELLAAEEEGSSAVSTAGVVSGMAAVVAGLISVLGKVLDVSMK